MSSNAKKGPRACTTCAKAKARCIPGPPGTSTCERCHRLTKPCASQVSTAKPKLRKCRVTRVAELERRLEELARRVTGSEDAPTPTPSERAGPWNKEAKGGITLGHLFPSPPGTSPVASDEGKEKHERGKLEAYKATRAALFPFVPVDSPGKLLHRAILVTEDFWNGQRQRNAMTELLRDIVNEAFLGSCRGGKDAVDLVQALLVIMAWSHFDLNAFQLGNLCFLGRGIVAGGKDDGIDVIRGFAGVWYLNSCVFTTNPKADVTMDVDVEGWIKLIETEGDLPGDEFLVLLLKVQLLSQRISREVVYPELCVTGRTRSGVAIEEFIKDYAQRLDAFKSDIPAGYKENPTLLSHIATAQTLLYSPSLLDEITPHITTPRLSLLSSLSRSLKTHLSLRFPPSYDPRDPLSNEGEPKRLICLASYDFAYALLTSLRLASLKIPGWDRLGALRDIGLSEVISMQIAEMEALVQLRGTESKIDPFVRLMGTLKHLHSLLKKEQVRIMAEERVFTSVQPSLPRPNTPLRMPRLGGTPVIPPPTPINSAQPVLPEWDYSVPEPSMFDPVYQGLEDYLWSDINEQVFLNSVNWSSI